MSCGSPRLICKPSRRYDSPARYYKQNLHLSVTSEYLYSVSVVPCGKCLDCLKRRQSDIAARAVREAHDKGSMHLVTLTYRDEMLPLSISLQVYDIDSGQLISSCPSRPMQRDISPDFDLPSEAYVLDCRARLKHLKKSQVSRKLYVPWFTDEEEGIYREFCITPSLHRRDVRLWLKSARVQYERDFGKPLPDFTYICCGEYGPKTCRPHYHLCFFGLSDKQIYYLCERWRYTYNRKSRHSKRCVKTDNMGFYNVKRVKAKNADGTDGFAIASRYVSKYVAKGNFECDSAKCGLAEKPRLCLSSHFGSIIDSDAISYYRAYDLFGRYDIETLCFDNGSKMSPEQLSEILKIVSERSKLQIDSQNFCLPAAIKSYIWNVVRVCFNESIVSPFADVVYDKSLSKAYIHNGSVLVDIPSYHQLKKQYGKDVSIVKGSLRSCSLRKFNSYLALDRYLARCHEFYEKVKDESNSKDLVQRFNEFKNTKAFGLSDYTQSCESEALRAFYSRSIY